MWWGWNPSDLDLVVGNLFSKPMLANVSLMKSRARVVFGETKGATKVPQIFS
jgi:hypothetical protein